MKDIVRKLTSRKLLLAITGVATGLCLIFGGDSSEINAIAECVKAIAGAITSIVSIVAYITTEGKIDAAAVANGIQQSVEKVEDIIVEVEKIEDIIGAEVSE